MQASIFNFCRPSHFYLWHFSVSEDEYFRNSKRFPCMATLMFLRLHRLSDYTSNITTGSAYCSHSTWEKGLSVVFLIQMNRETTGFLLFFYLESEQITPYAVTWRVGRLEEETSGYTDTWENKGTNSLWRITLSEVHSIHKKGNRFTTPRFSTEIFNLKKITATFSRNSHCFHKLTFLVKYPPWKHSALKKNYGK